MMCRQWSSPLPGTSSSLVYLEARASVRRPPVSVRSCVLVQWRGPAFTKEEEVLAAAAARAGCGGRDGAARAGWCGGIEVVVVVDVGANKGGSGRGGVVVCLAFVPRRKRPYVPPGRLGFVYCCVSHTHTTQILTMPLPPLPAAAMLLLCAA
jgi:hypothetical protein